MNQIFITGRVSQTEKTSNGENIMIAVYQYSPDGIEYIPVTITKESSVYIGRIRRGDLVSIIGKIIFETDSLKIIAEKINYAG